MSSTVSLHHDLSSIRVDDHDWKKVAPKEGQTFMVIGAAGELPKPPEKPIVFLEGAFCLLFVPKLLWSKYFA